MSIKIITIIAVAVMAVRMLNSVEKLKGVSAVADTFVLLTLALLGRIYF